MHQDRVNCTRDVASGLRLLISFDLGLKRWTLAFLGGALAKPRVVTIAARDLERLVREVARMKKRADLPDDAPVSSCYEAGRDGFWLHRALSASGWQSLVVDSASIERGRRAKEKKTDRIDAVKLVEMLWRHHYEPTDQPRWSVLRVPSVEQEDARQEERERLRLDRERTRCRNQMRSLLATHGIECRRLPRREELVTLSGPTGDPLPARLRASLEHLLAQLALLEQQVKDLRTAQRERIQSADTPIDRAAARMMDWRGIDLGALVIAQEFAWRDFRNTGQVGAAAGLTGCTWSSGTLHREQGLTRSGNPRVRHAIVQLAWSWVRYQPTSDLTRWYQRRFSKDRRLRKVGIIALARKLLIALWKYWTTGTAIDGAVLKPRTA